MEYLFINLLIIVFNEKKSFIRQNKTIFSLIPMQWA